GGDGGRVRIRGPFGLRRTAITSVDRVQPPDRLEGTALLGRTRAEVAWDAARARRRRHGGRAGRGRGPRGSVRPHRARPGRRRLDAPALRRNAGAPGRTLRG